MRQGQISGGLQPVTSLRPPVECAEDHRVMIEFPLTPDDVRLRSQTMSRLSSTGCASGLAGFAITILGVAGMATAGYICLEADSEVDKSIVAHDRRWLGYGFGGGMAILSSMAVTFGLSQVCLTIRRRRDAAQEMSALSGRARFESASAGGRV